MAFFEGVFVKRTQGKAERKQRLFGKEKKQQVQSMCDCHGDEYVGKNMFV